MIRFFLRFGSPALGAALLAACGAQRETTESSLYFVDATAQSGLLFRTTSGETPSTQILEVKGGGLALIDHDVDGDFDVFVPNGATMADPERGPGCRLFENMLEASGGALRFRDATAAAGLTYRRWGFGVAVGDHDGDGLDDLYVTSYGKNALLACTGQGRFEEVTSAAGVGGRVWSVAAAFGDVDADGDLDLYVANYLVFDIDAPPPPSTFKGAPVFTGPRGLAPEPDVLYENLGDGTFRELGEEAGHLSVEPGYGLGTVILDFDADGTQDVFVGNDSTPNFLFLNQGGSRFEEVGTWSGLAANLYGSTQATMGIAIGDVNGNGFADVFTTNFSNDTNTLHVNRGGRFFDDATARHGLGMAAFPYVGWASGLYDFDHDGDEDLLVFNGHVYPNATGEAMDADFDDPPLLYAREGDRFRRVDENEAGAFLAARHCDRGAAFGDLDRDGDVDVVVLELNGPLRMLENEGASAGWLVVELDPTSLGSRIELSACGERQTRWIHSGGSFASASAQYAHFGLPEGCREADVVITWPDGGRQRVGGVAADQHVIVRRE